MLMRKKQDSRRIRSLKKAAACALALVFLLSACGAAKNNSAATESSYRENASEKGAYAEDNYDYTAAAEDSDEEVYAEDEYGGEDSDAGAGGVEQADLESSNRKIVYTGNISLQTLEYDKSSQSVHEKIEKYGGFIESEDSRNEDPYWYYRERSGSSAERTRRSLNITARIPAEQFDAFMKDLENDGQVINTSINAQNISVSYATHDASKKALEIERDRLLEMMDKAETIEEMIAVEERLTEVERELGNETTTLTGMDRDVNFSTVYISVEEVFEYSETVVETTYGEKLQRAFGRAIDGFVKFWQDVLLFIVGSFPFLIMLAILIFVIVKVSRRSIRRGEEKRAAMEAARRAAAMAGPSGIPAGPGPGRVPYPGAFPGPGFPGGMNGAPGGAGSVPGAANVPAGGEVREKGFFHRKKKNHNIPPVPAAEEQQKAERIPPVPAAEEQQKAEQIPPVPEAEERQKEEIIPPVKGAAEETGADNMME